MFSLSHLIDYESPPSFCRVSGERPDPPNTLHTFPAWMPPTLHNRTLNSPVSEQGSDRR